MLAYLSRSCLSHPLACPLSPIIRCDYATACLSKTSAMLLASALLCTACQQKPDDVPSKASKEASSSANTINDAVIIADTPATLPPAPTATQRLDSPVWVAGTPMLLHPIVTVYSNDKPSLLAKDYSESGTRSGFVTPVTRFDYRTQVNNLIFEDLATGTKQRLFSHNGFIITRVFFPHISSVALDKKRLAEKKAQAKLNADLAKTKKANVDKNSADKSDTDKNRSHKNDNKTTRPITASAPIAPAFLEQLDLAPMQESSVDSTATLANTKTPSSNNMAVDNMVLLPRVIFEVNELPSANKADSTNAERMALYMSEANGKGVTRLHPTGQYLVNANWLAPLQRLYLITQADSDGDGKLTNQDKVYYYFVDFTESMPTIRAYKY